MTWLTGGLVVTFEDITIEHNVNKTKRLFPKCFSRIKITAY